VTATFLIWAVFFKTKPPGKGFEVIEGKNR
jgi:hypothetical protein